MKEIQYLRDIMKGEKNHNINLEPDRRVDFLLCSSCFWCASHFNIGESSITKCPTCHNNCMEQLPVSIRPELHITPLSR
jgi:hypothetical protein